jgi:hypothetical protein
MRFQHKREFYIPKGAVKFADRESSAVVYAFTNAKGKPALIGFHGRAQKPDFHYYYRDEERRERAAREFFKRWRDWEAARKAYRAKPHSLKVGSILRSSWGYDQTNIDYYEVTKLIGQQMVEIREIEQTSYENGWLRGRCAPLPGAFKGEPMRKRARDNSVKIASYAYAFLIEPKIEAGIPVYEDSGWTAYA